MKIAKVVDQLVVKTLDIVPENLENTSNFVALSPAEMRIRGWYPIEEIKPALGPYETYGQPTVAVQADKVVYTYPVVPAVLATVKAEKRSAFRDQLTAQLYATYSSDEFVVLLLAGAVPAAVKNRAIALKAAYDNAVTELNAQTTVAQALAVNPVWP